MKYHDAALAAASILNLVFVGSSFAQAAEVSSHPMPGTPPVAEVEQAYVLGPDDTIEVQVPGRTDFTSRVRVASDGTITLPYLGITHAGGKTTQQLSSDLAAALEARGFFSHPFVRVEIVSHASRYVIVLGSVGVPGLVPIDRPYRLSEIIARAGGIREGGANFVKLRSDDGAERSVTVDDLAAGGADKDPFVRPGDKVYVPPAELFYISGQVKAPGAYALLDGLTIRMAIARGGGLTDAGSEKRVELTRKGKRTAHVSLDMPLQSGDIVTADEGLF